MPFTTIGLSDRLVQGILATGYTAPTEIQSEAIPAAIAGRDIIGCAQTGTGKTAAFVLPMLHRLTEVNPEPKGKVVRALILTPTRELAAQIEKSIQNYGRFLKLRSLAVYGGTGMGGQLNVLRRGVDIVVATPGRLIDHMQRNTIDLGHVEILVLDEADRMFDMGFINDVRRIIRGIPEKRQTMLFSATISPEVKALVESVQKSPKIIQVGRVNNPIETITQYAYKVEQDLKLDFLLHLLKTTSMYSVLVFSRTKHGADRIRRRLDRENVTSVALHSGRTQGQRQQALDGFKRGKFQVMVATDIAARGIDVTGISHVINYDVPVVAEDYVHRIGRTGRAAATGDAITFVCRDEEKSITRIERFINRKLHLVRHDTFSYKKTAVPEKKHHTVETPVYIDPLQEDVPAAKKPFSKKRFGSTPGGKYGPQKYGSHGGGASGDKPRVYRDAKPGVKHDGGASAKPAPKHDARPDAKPAAHAGPQAGPKHGPKPAGKYGPKPGPGKKFKPKFGRPHKPNSRD
jgi:ATP-dependent RNA helicase RhlE